MLQVTVGIVEFCQRDEAFFFVFFSTRPSLGLLPVLGPLGSKLMREPMINRDLLNADCRLAADDCGS